MSRSVPPRSEIDKKYTWDLESMFPTQGAWEEAVHRVDESVNGVGRFRGTLDNPTKLLEYLRAVDDLGAELDRIYIYAHMSYDVDTSNQEAKSRVDRAAGLWSRATAATAYGEPEILELGRALLDRWIDEDSDLKLYAHYFDGLIRRQAHVRSPDVEETLGMVGDAFSSASATHSVLADTDLTFEPVQSGTGQEIELVQGNIDALLTDGDRELREAAWTHYADAFLAFKNTVASCLATSVKQHVFRARARRYESVLEAALSPEHIPVEVFHNLIETFRRNLPTWHRYWRIKRDALGYADLRPHDIAAPLVKQSLHIPFDQSVEWIVEGMRPLGDEYVDALRRGVQEQRWVDVYPNQNKSSGAYSTGAQGTNPFILMSYNDDVYGMSTLAHELGHSLHSFFSWQTQPHVYADYSLFVAEVASNFNQALVRAHLLQTNGDPEFQIGLIEEAMANFYRYFLIMPTLARFELEIHEQVWRGEGLTADGMTALMSGLFREAYGDVIVMDEDRAGITWAQFPTHLYANFYVYQYATGISAAHSLADSVLVGTPGAAEKYLSFLRTGGSLYPLDALKLAGVDMASPEPVEKTFKTMASMVDRLEKLTKARG